MYLTRNYQLRIQDMLFLSGEMCSNADSLVSTIMFLRSIMNGSNDYVSIKSVLPWFKLVIPFKVNCSAVENVLFSNPGAQAKRQKVLERYIENSYAQLESGAKSCQQLQKNVAMDLFVATYEVFEELGLFFQKNGFCKPRCDLDEPEYRRLLQFLDIPEHVDSPLVSAIVRSAASTYEILIKQFVNTYTDFMHRYWGKLEVFAQEYSLYIKSYAQKLLLLIELRKCCQQPTEPRRNSRLCCNIFSLRVVQFSRAQVKVFLDQIEAVFSQSVSNLAVLKSYMRLLDENHNFVAELLQQYPDRRKVIDDLWVDLMPVYNDAVTYRNDVNVVQLKQYSRNR
jgi:hypothetical protein